MPKYIVLTVTILFSGVGLGAKEHGITQAIKVKLKMDSAGVSILTEKKNVITLSYIEYNIPVYIDVKNI